MPRLAAMAGVLLLIAITAWWIGDNAPRPTVLVRLPDLSPEATKGQALFQQHCSPCHGPKAGGTDQGPPLVHPVYHPNHHADGAFALAITQGVTAHHWPFGDMPPVAGVTLAQVPMLAAFVRELQKANGIY
ncbi:cytochrome c [Magnetospira sp. QH-2]|uniref:c-type cytochrome n=1 Tax=Magnetospira sp. (strain QH-2) TaxID=1288970 RepID=UPI0005F9E582|nr:cytochrome c [Magnetospira sp. QH-2]